MSTSGEVRRRQGAVAVICQDRRFLVIRRSQSVEAPGTFCFPGGAIEDGETPAQAVRRELHEELGVNVEPLRLLWQSITPWNVELSWWLTALEPQATLQPNAAEVDEVRWLTAAQMRQLPALLASNHQFLEAWHRGEFQL